MADAIKLFLVSLLLVSALQAQVNVGTDGPAQQVVLTVAGGTLDSIHVTTQGSESQGPQPFDFTLAPGGSCAVGQSYLKGQTCTVNLAFHPLYPGERRAAVTLIARDGSVMAQQYASAQALGAVTTFVPATITTVAGNQAWIYAGDGQPAAQTSIFLPFGLAVNAAGDLYLADSSNNRIRKVTAATGLVSTLAGNGNVGATGDGGPATLATVSNPGSVAIDAAGNLYFSDSGNNAVRRIDAYTGSITTVAGRLGSLGYSGDGGPATNATLNTPQGLTLDAAGNLYIADTGNNVIRRLNSATGRIVTIAGTGNAGFAGDGGSAIAATLNSPWSCTVVPTGELYIADQNNHRVRKVDLAGVISTVAGTGTAGFSGDHSAAAAAMLNEPASVAVDVAGNLYIADSGNNRIRKVNAGDATIVTVAGFDSEAFSGDTGPADQAGLYGPYTLALDGADNLYIADVFHNRIRKITANQSTLKFPAMRVGRVSPPLPQTVENDGNAPLHFSSIQGVANAQVDLPTTVCATSTPLLPLATCVSGVDFAPTVTGDPVYGKVALASDAGNSAGIITPYGTVLDIDPTTLSLASSLNPALTSQTITFSVTATSAGSTPTGTVTFTDVFTPAIGPASTTSLGTASLTAGNASISTSSLLTGQHSITAAYSGDSSNAAATTTPALVEIVKDAQAPTVTTLISSANPIDAGAPLILTALVQTKTPGAGSFTLAGTVTISEGSTSLGTVSIDLNSATLDRGSATLTLSNLPVGTHNLTAAYAGNNNDAPSASTAIAQVVHIATTSITLTPGANPTIAGAPLSLTATVSSTGSLPTGTVTFLAGTGILGSGTINGQGVATLQLASVNWPPGSYLLTATYAGDAKDTPASSQPVNEQLKIATATVTLGSSLNPAGLGAPILLTANVTTDGGTATGTVTFLDGTASIGLGTLNPAGLATLALGTLSIGNHTLRAVYSGDVADASATSAPLVQEVDAATIAISLATSKSPALYGDTLTFTAVVTGSGSKPAGTVLFVDSGAALSTVPLDAAGQANFTTSALAIGAHSITATYSGDANHAAVLSSVVSEPVLQVTSLGLSTSATRAIAGQPITIKAVLAGANQQPVTGPILLADGSTPLATLTPDATGTVTFSALLAVGTHNLTAGYSGDRNDAPANSPAVAVEIDIAATTTMLVSSANPAGFSAPVTWTATVTGNGATPGGSVTFTDGASVLGSVTLAATAGAAGTTTGTASLTLASLTPGIHNIAARYSGDSNDQPSQSPALSQQVALRSTLKIASSANPALLTDTFTVTITAGNGNATPPSGPVVLSDNGQVLATLALSGGSASYTFNAPPLGDHNLSATYAGDPSNSPASAAPLLEVVSLRPSTTNLTASATALSAGQQLILISIVQAQGQRAATGSVTFQSGSTVLGTSPISTAGVATLTLNPAAGAYSIVAQYSGDSLYAPSASPAVPVVVGPPIAFTLTATPAQLSLQSGQHATLTLAIDSNPTFHDTLALGCAGLPANATCTFSSDRLAVTPGLPQTLTVTVDTGNPLGAGASASLDNRTGAPFTCLLPAGALLAWLLRKRKPMLRSLIAALLLAVTLASVTGCATHFTQSTTPAGAYSFQITGSGTTTTSTQAATVQLTVTQ